MKLRDLVHRVRKRPSKSKDGEILEERLEEVLQQRFGIFVLNDAVTSNANAVE
ncbi:Ff.00g117220.m01.CDS01 [Fusarium sp. VM40]|nr:Ff.00g117220.m01.CDS01 [Fusarium sp. VM40]